MYLTESRRFWMLDHAQRVEYHSDVGESIAKLRCNSFRAAQGPMSCDHSSYGCPKVGVSCWNAAQLHRILLSFLKAIEQSSVMFVSHHFLKLFIQSRVHTSSFRHCLQ
jgi:hypothetical protein